MPLKIIGLFGETRPKKSQNGVYDPRILCAQCDQYIGIWDQHACETLRAEARRLEVAQVDDGPAIDADGRVVCYTVGKVDPQKLAMFALSVLWRCHHSDREEARVVNLGPHADAIREVLLANAPIGTHDYSVWLEFNEDFPMVMWIGRWRPLDEVTVNSFMAQNFTFHMKTDQKKASRLMESVSLKLDKPVLALALRKGDSRFGQSVVAGIRRSHQKFGDPWKGLRGLR